jgi:lipopolysaccharide export system protein LptA
MRLLLILSFVFCTSFLCVSANNDLSKFKILGAEVLNYQDGNSILIGNVAIKYGDYIFRAPEVYINTVDGKPSIARFINGASLNSDDLNITAPIMEVEISSSKFKCFSNSKSLVETTIKSKNSNKPMLLSAGYQEFNLNTGFATARGDESIELSQKHGYRVMLSSEDLEIESDSLELSTENNKLQYVDFIGKVIARDDTQRTEAHELFYFPEQEIIKAYSNVKILYLNENEPSYLFSDLVIYERRLGNFSAMSTSIDSQAEVHANKTRGLARQIILTMNQDNKPERAILTGNAYAQYDDKSILGHEVLLNIQDQTIETIVGRPKTHILSHDKTNNNKAKKKNRPKK